MPASASSTRSKGKSQHAPATTRGRKPTQSSAPTPKPEPPAPVNPPAPSDPPEDSKETVDPTASWPTHIEEVPATAGHGPARAAAFLAVAEAFGATGHIEGSTRSTGSDEGVFAHLRIPSKDDIRVLEDLFSSATSAMEDAARVRRAKVRDELRAASKLDSATYTLNLAQRSALVGFGQGLATVLAKQRGSTVAALRVPATMSPVKAARFRKGNLDEPSRKSGYAAGVRFGKELVAATPTPEPTPEPTPPADTTTTTSDAKPGTEIATTPTPPATDK